MLKQVALQSHNSAGADPGYCLMQRAWAHSTTLGCIAQPKMAYVAASRQLDQEALTQTDARLTE